MSSFKNQKFLKILKFIEKMTFTQEELTKQQIKGSFCSIIDDDNKYHDLDPLKIDYAGEMHSGILSLRIHHLYKSNVGKNESSKNKAVLLLPKSHTHCISKIDCLLNGERIDIKIEETEKAKEIEKEGETEGKTTVRSTISHDNRYLNIILGSLNFGSEIDVTICIEILSTNIDSSTYQTIIPFSEKSASSGEFTFSIEFDQIESIFGITIVNNSEKDKFKYKLEGNKFTIDTKPTNPIVMHTKLKNDIQSTIQNDSNDEYSVISVVPHFLNKSLNSDFVFIVDCSGSMSGRPIKNASECLSIFLHSLPVGCKFNVIRFGSDFVSFFEKEGLVEYNEENLNFADQKVKNLKANMGCTNLFEPLSKAYEYGEKMSQNGNVVQIFLLTDGEIHDNDSVFKLVNRNRSKSRIFSIGIGDDVDKNLVSGLSQISSGKYDFVYNSDDITSKVVNLLSSSLVPALTNISVHISTDGNDSAESVEVVPNPLVPLYDGSISYIYVKKQTKSKGIENVLINGNIANEDVEIVIDKVSPICESSAKKLFAFKAISDYEKIYDDISESENEEKTKELQNKIIKLSIESGILSKFTSFVGVANNEKQSDDDDDPCDSLLMPIFGSAKGRMISSDDDDDDDDKILEPDIEYYHEKEELRQILSSNRKPICVITGKGRMISSDDDCDEFEIKYKYKMKRKQFFAPEAAGVEPQSKRKAEIEPKIENTLTSIVSLQDFDGKWKYSLLDQLIDILGINRDNKAFISFISSLNVKNEEIEGNIKSTVIAICILNKLYINDQSKWMLIEKKAINWLNSQVKANWENDINKLVSILN